MECIQYTVRGVPRYVDIGLRDAHFDLVPQIAHI